MGLDKDNFGIAVPNMLMSIEHEIIMTHSHQPFIDMRLIIWRKLAAISILIEKPIKRVYNGY